MNPIRFSEARHLLARTSIGVEWRAVQQLTNKVTRSQAVDRVLQSFSYNTGKLPRLTPLHKMELLAGKGSRGKQLMNKVMMHENDVLKQWWVKRMLTSVSPLAERLTLFWHNHFTSSLARVERPQLLLQQHLLLRQHAMGNFASLLKQVSRDPAMMIYLDADQNIKGHANENFARELLELFTLGHGHYSEQDIQNAARAFTGWSVDRQSGRFIYRDDLHDNGLISFMGQRGFFSGDDILNIVLQEPRTAEHIAEKFWNAFINQRKPEPKMVSAWGDHFRRSGYEIRVLLSEVLNSEVFWAEENRGALTKAPVELIVGSMRTLPHRVLTTKEIVHTSRILGQDLFDPPNVKGWQGGKDWINTQTLLIRTSLQHKMFRDDNIRAMKRHFAQTPEDTLAQWLLPKEPVLPPPHRPGKLWYVQNLMFDPVYQLT